MAIVLESYPAAYTPAYNPQWWVASSSQSAQPNFRYRVVLTDLLTNESVTRDIDADASSLLVFDSGSFAEQFITRICPSGLYGFQSNTGAVRKIRVNIGEVYGSTPVYYSGANTDYIVWDGAIDWLEMQSYDVNDYRYTQSPGGWAFPCNDKDPVFDNQVSSALAYREREKTFNGHSSYIYALTTASSSLEKLRVIGYDASGNVLSTSVIGNINLSGSTAYQSKFIFIDVGFDGLENMPSAQVISGTYPIPVSTFDYYLVQDYSAWIAAYPFSPTDYYNIKYFDVKCEPKFDVITLHYLTPAGDFGTQPFAKLSLRTQQGNKSYYSRVPYAVTGSNPTRAVTYNRSDTIERVLNSNQKERITLNTDWLEEYEVTRLKDLIASPEVYLSFGDGTGYISVKVIPTSYEEKRKYNSKLINVSVEVEYTHLNVRQRQ